MEAIKFNTTRIWIKRAISGSRIYFVVGFHTITNARIVHKFSKDR